MVVCHTHTECRSVWLCVWLCCLGLSLMHARGGAFIMMDVLAVTVLM